MKVIVYNATQKCKEELAVANRKKYHITFVSNPLNESTIRFTKEKDAAVIYHEEIREIIRYKKELPQLKYIVHIQQKPFPDHLPFFRIPGARYESITPEDPKSAAQQIIGLLEIWQESNKVHR